MMSVTCKPFMLSFIMLNIVVLSVECLIVSCVFIRTRKLHLSEKTLGTMNATQQTYYLVLESSCKNCLAYFKEMT